MAALEAEAFICGKWKNFAEIEEDLCLQELIAVVDQLRKQKRQDREFAAALKGINLGDQEESNRVEEMKKRIRARAAGIEEDSYELFEAGFGIESEDE